MAIVTLCFVKVDNKILMINRNKYPFMGMWNAVGGHVEEGEDVLAGAIREIKEEGNLEVKDAKLVSISTWNYDDDLIYVYVSNLPSSFDISKYPIKISEGIIDFKDIDWVLDEKNYGIVPDLRIFINDIKHERCQNYHLVYDNDKLIEVIKK
ncbi:MAG: NUDIX domain-containing protein [Bacilli bacterium]|nr:NUDIX domain-containing protein [Bacilli bacterium]